MLHISGLFQDGCRLGSSSIVYTSVKSARACVAKLHQKNLSGATVWARQLGGEVSFYLRFINFFLENFTKNLKCLHQLFVKCDHVMSFFLLGFQGTEMEAYNKKSSF